MAQTRHRVFEIFEFLQEASDALTSKSARVNEHTLDPDLWRFRQLVASIESSGIAHITFKLHETDESQPTEDFAKDMADLASYLTNGSRVLLDFEGVEKLDSDAIATLTEFKGKLQNKGSRVVLCNLEPTALASFFPHLSTNSSRRP